MSKIDYQDLSAKIMDNIGGVKNVKTALMNYWGDKA